MNLPLFQKTTINTAYQIKEAVGRVVYKYIYNLVENILAHGRSLFADPYQEETNNQPIKTNKTLINWYNEYDYYNYQYTSLYLKTSASGGGNVYAYLDYTSQDVINAGVTVKRYYVKLYINNPNGTTSTYNIYQGDTQVIYYITPYVKSVSRTRDDTDFTGTLYFRVVGENGNVVTPTSTGCAIDSGGEFIYDITYVVEQDYEIENQN